MWIEWMNAWCLWYVEDMYRCKEASTWGDRNILDRFWPIHTYHIPFIWASSNLRSVEYSNIHILWCTYRKSIAYRLFHDVLVYVWPAQPIKWKISFPDIIILYTYMWHTYTTSNVNGNQYRLLWVSFSASIRNFRRPDFICVFFFFFVRSITVCSATEHCYVRHTSVALRTRFPFWWYHESIFLRKFDFHLIFHWKKQKPILPTGKSLQRTHHRHKEDSQT